MSMKTKTVSLLVVSDIKYLQNAWDRIIDIWSFQREQKTNYKLNSDILGVLVERSLKVPARFDLIDSFVFQDYGSNAKFN
jgi:hypothetical protein